MNPSKVEEDLFHHHLDPHHHHHQQIMDHHESQPSILDHHHHQEPFSLPSISEIVLFRDDDDDNDSLSHSSSDADNDSASHTTPTNHRAVELPPTNDAVSAVNNPPKLHSPAYISPEPHISTQFYTFNRESHALMIRCILEGRLATPEEIRAATPLAVLGSWRSVWKDRNEDTAYLTAWKRIQDKLNAHVSAHEERDAGRLEVMFTIYSLTEEMDKGRLVAVGIWVCRERDVKGVVQP